VPGRYEVNDGERDSVRAEYKSPRSPPMESGPANTLISLLLLRFFFHVRKNGFTLLGTLGCALFRHSKQPASAPSITTPDGLCPGSWNHNRTTHKPEEQVVITRARTHAREIYIIKHCRTPNLASTAPSPKNHNPLPLPQLAVTW
jgi:hypothetical protein